MAAFFFTAGRINYLISAIFIAGIEALSATMPFYQASL
ncbi:putative membrane protein [Escherichia coli 1-176-05_S3_C2]|nr:putative membrane protein [Escherichia coli 1-176-05_S3_C2]